MNTKHHKTPRRHIDAAKFDDKLISLNVNEASAGEELHQVGPESVEAMLHELQTPYKAHTCIQKDLRYEWEKCNHQNGCEMYWCGGS